MFFSQASFILVFLSCAAYVRAHGHVAKWTIDGKEQPGWDPSNPGIYGATAERPTDNNDQGPAKIDAPIIACGGVKAPSDVLTWDVQAGSTVTAHWNTWPTEHMGPITEYMARCPDSGCGGVDAASLDWFKIAEESYDGTEWPTQRLSQSLAYSFKMPSNLASGQYLVRHSLLAMHSTNAPQVYPVCFQANLISSGSTVPSETVKFPAAYNINDGFKSYNIWTGDANTFVPPGPAVYSGGSTGGAAPAPAPAPAPSVAPTGAPAPVPAPTTSAGDGAATPSPSSQAAPVPSTSPVNVPVPAPTTGGQNGATPPPVADASGKPKCMRRRKARRSNRALRS